jgi:hypothetical protein
MATSPSIGDHSSTKSQLGDFRSSSMDGHTDTPWYDKSAPHSIKSAIPNKSGITGLSLIGLVALTCLICVVIMVAFERYYGNRPNKLVVRIILIAFMINIALFIFLPMSFSKITFEPGPPGPKGIRGRRGPNGIPDAPGCKAQPASLGKLRLAAMREANETRFQAPLLTN